MSTVTPAEPFVFEHSTLTTADSLKENCDAWESMAYTSIGLITLGSDINTGWTLDGDQPPGLDIDGKGVISGTVESGIFKPLVQEVAEKKEQGNVTIETGSGEIPSSYGFGSGVIIRKAFEFTVSGINTDPPSPVPVVETWIIRVGKNWTVDVGDFDPETIYTGEEE